MDNSNHPSRGQRPERQGLYDPQFEHDGCGIGFVVDIAGRPSNSIVRQAIQVLNNLNHRGACGCDPETGDGAGILMQIPDAFFRACCAEIGFALPPAGEYAAGMVFLPRDAASRLLCEAAIEKTARKEGLRILGWRDVPGDPSKIGRVARDGEPKIRQVFIEKSKDVAGEESFERKLYILRKLIERGLSKRKMKEAHLFYISSLSSRTVVYKGMLTANQLEDYYLDLHDERMESAIALVHSRFSTNTFPSWDLAHPYRFLCHNGEINTLQGNRNWMRARQVMASSPLLGGDVNRLTPIVSQTGSDSATIDNALEFLVMGGRSLPHAMLMLIPEAWNKVIEMDPDKLGFYEFHSCLMEPWDGPAAILFSNGRQVGGILDRNGLRPCRFVRTRDGRVIMASETGVLPIHDEDILEKGRLQPGRMFLVDTVEGRIILNEELKMSLASRKPYRQWVDENRVDLDDVPEPPHRAPPAHNVLLQRQQAFGYTAEDIRILMAPMAREGEEAIGSMGNDTPLAVLSERPQPLYNYFKQLFAQVTNPAIDSIREDMVMSLETYIGSEGNLLDETPRQARMLKIHSPVLTNEDLEKIRHIDLEGFKTVTLSMVFPVAGGEAGFEKAVDQLCQDAEKAVQGGACFLILSDKGVNPEHAPIPSLLAAAAIHHHLIREGLRTQAAIILESGEARETGHFALLVGYGAAAINPYLAFETLEDLIRDGLLPKDMAVKTAFKNYIKSVDKALLKVMAKMGISTVQSYRGAQIFEAIGLNAALIDKYFTGTTSRIGGVGIDAIAKEVLAWHRFAFPKEFVYHERLDVGGQYQWRHGGEYHMFNPDTIAKLQYSTRISSYEKFKEFSKVMNEEAARRCTLRGLLKFRKGNPIPIEEVEPAKEIIKRFATGAMSFGSISKEAHETLAIAMNRIGGKSNTGEGGEDPVRYKLDPSGDSRNSAIKQVASGRFGVTAYYLVNAQELQIKIAQGAKPGEGGQLPGHKVDKVIARVRHSTPGVGLISPPPHHDIYSIEDLAQLIHDLKNANSRARISVKLVAEVGVGTIAAGVAKAKADVVLISGHEGGTGASPLTSIKHAGIPWELGLAETHQILLMNDLRSRIVVQTDGQLKTGRDIAIATLLGAEEYGFATAPLVVLGCIMMRVCHLNTCPVGIATQDPVLRQRFAGQPEHVINFFFFVAEELREIMAQLGFRTVNEMVGRADMLETDAAIDHWKAKGVDLSKLLYRPQVPENRKMYRSQPQDHGLERALDHELIRRARPAIENGTPVRIDLPITNGNRTVGTMLSGEVAKRWGLEGLPADTIRIRFQGSAGQSFGAFLAPGITMDVEGDANDYVGKGLSGGRLVIVPPRHARFVPEKNILIGNTVLYGATSGEAYFRGLAGERFAVRNSGAKAVVEGVGDHGCEYMTGGRVVVIGPTGRNFAAGMSGGIAYVLDEDGQFVHRCNSKMVSLETLNEDEDFETLRYLLERHIQYTGSPVAERIFKNWQELLGKFVKIMPIDYKRVRDQAKEEERRAEAASQAGMVA